MEKRTHTRIRINQEVLFSSENSKRFGTLANCSETGMYIKTMISYPFDSLYEILIPLKTEVLKVPVKVVRTVKDGGFYEGMGVKLLNLPLKYLDFVISHHEPRS